MLTANELAWLEKRGKHPYCQIWCMFDRNSDDCEWEQAAEYCPLVHGRKALIEAGQFEERVAATLALGCESQLSCHGSWQTHWKLCNLRKGYWDCADCFLKVARLKVEEEIDGKMSI